MKRNLQPSPVSRYSELTHAGALRLESRPDGRTSIEVIRIVDHAIFKQGLHLTSEEIAALDAAMRGSFGRAETPSVQLTLLPRERWEPRPIVPLPKGPSHAVSATRATASLSGLTPVIVKRRPYRFRRHKGGRRG